MPSRCSNFRAAAYNGPWPVILLVAAILEVGWAIGLKYAEGFTRLWPSVWTIAAMVASMYLLAIAARVLPIGTAYAVWTGIGAAGTAVMGMWLLGEPRSALRIGCIVVIIAGVIGLKVGS
jgi:quaternary ammonium compound-resistance protein SugE